MPLTSKYSLDEFMITAMARELDGEVLLSSVSAFGQLAGYLANKRYAPDVAVLSSPESGMDIVPTPTLTLTQFLTDEQNAIPLTMEETFDAILTDHFRIWINPAQIDQYGFTNISVIGDWQQPKVAMVGSRGIPEDTSHLSKMLYYIPNHNTRSVVDRVHFKSGNEGGSSRDKTLGKQSDPTILVTNLGIFDFSGPEESIAIRSMHPGVSVEEIQENSGCDIHIPENIEETDSPTEEDVQIIRNTDPLEVRKMEIASGSEAPKRFMDIDKRERQFVRRESEA